MGYMSAQNLTTYNLEITFRLAECELAYFFIAIYVFQCLELTFLLINMSYYITGRLVFTFCSKKDNAE